MDILEAVAGIVGATNVLTDAHTMSRYTTDWRGRYHGAALAAVRPATTREVSKILEVCLAKEVAVVPQGGNTGLVGGAIPFDPQNSIVVSLERMNRLRSLDTIDNTIVAEAGCTLATIREAAAEAGRLFPLSFGSEGSCQLGGFISTNAGGTAVLRYGNTRDLVLGLEVVLPDGSVWDGVRSLRKDNSGYDLKHLFIGAEGTLGVVTSACLKLMPQPTARATAWLGCDSLDDAVRLRSEMQEWCGDRISAFEAISHGQLSLVLRHLPDLHSPLQNSHPCHLLVELADFSDDDKLQSSLQDFLAGALENSRIRDAVMAAGQRHADAFWRIRHSVSEVNIRSGFSISHDTSVPISSTARFVSTATDAVLRSYPEAMVVFVGHLGDGNIHLVVIAPESQFASTEERERFAAGVAGIVHEAALLERGSISAEHGTGISRRSELYAHKSSVELDLMRRLKLALDPTGIMNPGKILKQPDEAPFERQHVFPDFES